MEDVVVMEISWLEWMGVKMESNGLLLCLIDWIFGIVFEVFVIKFCFFCLVSCFKWFENLELEVSDGWIEMIILLERYVIFVISLINC